MKCVTDRMEFLVNVAIEEWRAEKEQLCWKLESSLLEAWKERK